jgi:hypothetical protein
LKIAEKHNVDLLSNKSIACGFEKTVTETFSSEHEVTGSEDANVYFYDLARPKNSCVNKLQVCAMLNTFANMFLFFHH